MTDPKAEPLPTQVPFGETEEDQVRWLLDEHGWLGTEDALRLFATLDSVRAQLAVQTERAEDAALFQDERDEARAQLTAATERVAEHILALAKANDAITSATERAERAEAERDGLHGLWSPTEILQGERDGARMFAASLENERDDMRDERDAAQRDAKRYKEALMAISVFTAGEALRIARAALASPETNGGENGS